MQQTQAIIAGRELGGVFHTLSDACLESLPEGQAGACDIAERTVAQPEFDWVNVRTKDYQVRGVWCMQGKNARETSRGKEECGAMSGSPRRAVAILKPTQKVLGSFVCRTILRKHRRGLPQKTTRLLSLGLGQRDGAVPPSPALFRLTVASRWTSVNATWS
jgi:hypothetical protein